MPESQDRWKMEVRTYQARSMQEALRLVSEDLGPDASVIKTRQLDEGPANVEIVASPPGVSTTEVQQHAEVASPIPSGGFPSTFADEYCRRLKSYLKNHQESDSLLDDLCQSPQRTKPLSDALFRVFTDLLDAEFSEQIARALTERLRGVASADEQKSPTQLARRLSQMVRDEIEVRGPICITPGKCRVVALIGPTGVGKTTTVAKLAANFRLREKHRVGLITVDTYRIAAVEQLRTYADIIDLPMEVVATPREMREAVARFANLDIVLLDTAGRSPKDEIQIQELKALLGEARPSEVHLVLSSVAGGSNLTKTAEQFRTAGANALILTKLDEAMGLGNLLPLFETSKLPLSYVTNGQNVPDDIQIADRQRIVEWMVGSVGASSTAIAAS